MAKENPITFEGAMERLEQIVEQMESNDFPLEEMLERYEEGTKLAKLCAEKLSNAEKRIEIIARNATGKPQIADFETAPSPAGGSAQSTGEAASKSPKTSKTPSKPARLPSDDDISLF